LATTRRQRSSSTFGELRARLIIALSTAVAFAITYGLHGHLLDWLNRPLLHRYWRPGTFSPIEYHVP
jgi:hypothetical protein